jgi:hypothetical protein
LEREQTRVRTYLNELVANRKIFNRDLDTIKDMIKEKSRELRMIAGSSSHELLSEMPADSLQKMTLGTQEDSS